MEGDRRCGERAPVGGVDRFSVLVSKLNLPRRVRMKSTIAGRLRRFPLLMLLSPRLAPPDAGLEQRSIIGPIAISHIPPSVVRSRSGEGLVDERHNLAAHLLRSPAITARLVRTSLGKLPRCC